MVAQAAVAFSAAEEAVDSLVAVEVVVYLVSFCVLGPIRTLND